MMKPDAYTKIILTVIAVCLMALVIQNLNPVKKAMAGQNPSSESHYAKVPVNEDGTIDVKIKRDFSEKIMDVNIVRVAGNSTREGIPVKPNQHSLNINIEEVGGYQVYGSVPIKNK